MGPSNSQDLTKISGVKPSPSINHRPTKTCPLVRIRSTQDCSNFYHRCMPLWLREPSIR